MTDGSSLHPRLHRLAALVQPGWQTLAERSAVLFLVGGGLSLVTAILFAVHALTVVATEGIVTGVTGFTGIIISYVGLLGLYPWFATRTPRTARAGVVLVALPTLVIVTLLIWGVATHLPIGAVPSPVEVLPGIGSILVATFLLFAVGISMFGIASLRTGMPSRATGVLLVGLAATWVVFLGASSVYGTKFPTWLDTLMVGGRAILLLGIGQSLRAESVPITSTARSLGSR